MKYVYLWFVKMTPEALKKYIVDSKYAENWETKAKELCKKHGMKLLFLGSPYATVEQIVIGVETDVPLDEFGKLTTDLYHIDPAFIDYAKTLIISQ